MSADILPFPKPTVAIKNHREKQREIQEVYYSDVTVNGMYQPENSWSKFCELSCSNSLDFDF